jgi:hypothetical protein
MVERGGRGLEAAAAREVGLATGWVRDVEMRERERAGYRERGLKFTLGWGAVQAQFDQTDQHIRIRIQFMCGLITGLVMLYINLIYEF